MEMKKQNPYTTFIDTYCKICDWYKYGDEELSDVQIMEMKKNIEKCAVVRISLNRRKILDLSFKTNIENRCPRGFLHCDPAMFKCDIESLPDCHLHEAFMKNKNKKQREHTHD